MRDFPPVNTIPDLSTPEIAAALYLHSECSISVPHAAKPMRSRLRSGAIRLSEHCTLSTTLIPPNHLTHAHTSATRNLRTQIRAARPTARSAHYMDERRLPSESEVISLRELHQRVDRRVHLVAAPHPLPQYRASQTLRTHRLIPYHSHHTPSLPHSAYPTCVPHTAPQPTLSCEIKHTSSMHSWYTLYCGWV